MTGRHLKGLFIALFVLWAFFSLASFFASGVQKPFSATNVLAVGRTLLDLSTVAWLALLALAMGSWLLDRLLPAKLYPVETLILGMGLGLGGLGLLSLALGLAGLFYAPPIYGVTIVLSALFARRAISLLRRWSRWRPANRPALPAGLYLSLLALLALPVALLPPTDWDGLFYHLTGPKLYLAAGRVVGGIDIPHLSFPALMEMLYAWAILVRGDVAAKLLHTLFGLLLVGLVYLTARRFLGRKATWPAVLILASMPMLTILTGWAYNDLALAFYQLAALYAFVHYQLAVGDRSAASGERRAASEEWRAASEERIAASEEQKNEAEQSQIPNPKSQIPNLKSQISNLKSKIQNPKSKTQPRAWLILSAIFAGLSMGLKYTSFVTPLVIGGLILWQAYKTTRHQLTDLNFSPSRPTPDASRSPLPASSPPQPLASSPPPLPASSPPQLLASPLTGLADLAIFSLVALLVALPWYLKNWAFTGNPVYPFLFDWLGGRYWDAFRNDWYTEPGTGIGFRPGTLLALPWLLTLGLRDANPGDGRTGPLFLLFLPLVLFYGFFRSRRRAAGRPAALDTLLIYVLAQFGFWALGVMWARSLWQARLLLPGLAALAAVTGWIWADLPRFDLPHFSLHRFVNLVVGLTLTLTLVDVGLFSLKINPLPYLAGLETRDEYLTRRLGAHYAVMQQINQELPPEAVVLFLWEPRSYYCRRDCRPDSILDEFPHLVYQYRSAEAIARAWREAGVTHVLIHRLGLKFVLNEQPGVIDVEVLQALQSQYMQPVFDVVGAYQVYALPENLNKQE